MEPENQNHVCAAPEPQRLSLSLSWQEVPSVSLFAGDRLGFDTWDKTTHRFSSCFSLETIRAENIPQEASHFRSTDCHFECLKWQQAGSMAARGVAH